MMRHIETFVGCVLLVGAIACMPGLRHPMTTPAAAASETSSACPAPLRRAPMLCNRVLKDGSAECAICDAQNRGCMSSTRIYCAVSCDDVACVPRGGR